MALHQKSTPPGTPPACTCTHRAFSYVPPMKTLAHMLAPLLLPLNWAHAAPKPPSPFFGQLRREHEGLREGMLGKLAVALSQPRPPPNLPSLPLSIVQSFEHSVSTPFLLPGLSVPLPLCLSATLSRCPPPARPGLALPLPPRSRLPAW